MRFLTRERTRAVLFLAGLGIVAAIIATSLPRYRLARAIEAIRNEGYPTTFDERADWYPAIPDAENAALVYIEADRLMTEIGAEVDHLPIVGEVDGETRPESVTPEVAGQIDAFLEEHEPILGMLRRAASMPGARPPRGTDWMEDEAPLEYYRLVRQVWRLALLQFFQGIYTDRPEAVVDGFRIASSIAGSFATQPTSTSELVRIALVQGALEAIPRALAQVHHSDEDLVLLANALTRLESKDMASRALIAERVVYLETTGILGGKGFTELAQDAALEIHWYAWMDQQWEDLPYTIASFTGIRSEAWIEELALNKRLIESASLPYPEGEKVRRRIEFERDNLPKYIGIGPRDMSPFVGWTNFVAFGMLAETDARLACAETAIAIERFRLKHGRLPVRLDELVPEHLDDIPCDPIDEQPLRSAFFERMYMVYSVGKNGIDQGGLIAKPKLSDDVGIVVVHRR